MQKIYDDFAKLKFWEVPEEQYDKGWTGHALTGQAFLFKLRNGYQSKAVRAGGSDYAMTLLHVIEDAVDTARWRCPFDDNRGNEKCKLIDLQMRYAIEIFTKHELPLLLETYK